MLKVALAHDHLYQVGGAERVLAALFSLYPEAPVFTLINDKRISQQFLPQGRVISSKLQRIPKPSHWFKYFLILMPKIWEQTNLSDYDLVISSSSAFVKGLRVGPQTKHICYCHAPTRYLWDEKEEYLENLPEGRILKRFLPKILGSLQDWDYDKAQKVDYFIANSKYIADKIFRHYHRRATVIYPPIRLADFSVSPQTDEYYLIISRLRPYKKVDLAIKAFNNLKLPLKIIGSGTEYQRLKKIAQSNIEFLGELDDQQRNYYLSRCRAFIYPQIEDLGITALEAMACGRPVIAYAKGGALETVVEGLSGTFFPEQTWESLAHKILRFDANQYDPEKIRQHAAQFDEAIFKQKILDFVKNLGN
ncbi:MAG: glycosyltransferase [Patescibacteria group bacterium]